MKRLSLFLILFSTTLFSQGVEILEGDFSNLKGISAYNLVFDYSNLRVPNYNTEEDFLNSKIEEYEKAESSKGEKFKKDWFSNREKYYEPEFIERFNYYLKKAEIKVGKNLDNVDYANLKAVEYVMKIQTVNLHTEYDNAANRSNSKITVNISVYNSNEPESTLLKVRYYEVNAEASKDSNQTTRISKSYGQLGKLVAVDIRKYLK